MELRIKQSDNLYGSTKVLGREIHVRVISIAHFNICCRDIALNFNTQIHHQDMDSKIDTYTKKFKEVTDSSPNIYSHYIFDRYSKTKPVSLVNIP